MDRTPGGCLLVVAHRVTLFVEQGRAQEKEERGQRSDDAPYRQRLC